MKEKIKFLLDRIRKQRRLFIFVAVLFVGVGSYIGFNLNSNTYKSVVLTKDGFRPEILRVKKGDSVKFTTSLEKSFWPASNIHPTHEIYSEFDPKRPIKPGETWEFTFDKEGQWTYHDHLMPEMTGKIIVGGNILSSNNEECRNFEELSYNERQVCWYFEMKDIIKKEGIEEAFNRLSTLYQDEPTFQSGCHDVTHLIGDEAYQEFARGEPFEFTEKTTYCGYGFYHGFIEAILFGGGSYKQAQKFCEEINRNFTNIKSPNAVYSCYHGMGHAMFDQHDPRLWGDEASMVYPALDVCEKITDGIEEEKRKQCSTGIFNALGIAYSNDQYGLELNEEDPVWFCREQGDLYKKPCFIEVSIAWIYKSMGGGDYEFSEAKEFIESINDVEGEEISMFGLGSDYVRQNRNTFEAEDMVNECNSVKNSLRDECVKGVVQGLMGWSTPGKEYIVALDFCRNENLSKKQKDACMEYFLPRVGTLYSAEKTKMICSGIEEEYKDICR